MRKERLCVVLLLAALAICHGVDVKDKLYSVDKDLLLNDDEGKDVWFEALSEKELADHWSLDDGGTLAEKIEHLRDFEVTVPVDVRLVGFQGEGQAEFRLTKEDLLRYLDAADNRQRLHVMRTEPGQRHDLPFVVKYLYRVSHASKRLTEQITDNVHKAILSTLNAKKEIDTTFGVVSSVVPYFAVDDPIQEDHKAHAGSSYTLYILNLPKPKNFDVSIGQARWNQYSPNAQPQANGAPIPPHAGPMTVVYSYQQPYPGLRSPLRSLAFKMDGAGCTTSAWVGRERYAWIDLTAGPVTYGPQTSGEGIMTEFGIPHLTRIVPHSYQHKTKVAPADSEASAPQPDFDGEDSTQPAQKTEKPKASETALAPKHEFIAELTATIRRTSQYLFGPSIERFPVPFKKHLAINLIFVHDDSLITTEQPKGELNEKQKAAADHRHKVTEHWEEVREQLKALAFKGQEIEVNIHHLNFFDCELCVSAYTHSLKSHTSNIISNGLRTQVHQYLESTDMRDWLEHYDNNFWALKSSTAKAKSISPENIRVISAFIYDLKSADILLLDRFHQSVAYKDMVIGVQTRSSAAIVDYSCNGQTMLFDPRDASRSVLASLLKSVWGVAAPYEFYNPLIRDIETNYMWAIGHNPFGFFSSSRHLSFSPVDAAHRHVLLSDVNSTMTQLAQVFEHFSTFEHEIDEVLSPQQHLVFVRRWNVFAFKLERAKHFIGLNNFQQALYYMRSARHDLGVLHDLVHSAINDLQPVMMCEKDEAPSAGLSKSFRILLLIGAVTVFVYLVNNSYADSWLVQTIFRKKKVVF